MEKANHLTRILWTVAWVGALVLAPCLLRCEVAPPYRDSISLRFTDSAGHQYACQFKVINSGRGRAKVYTWSRRSTASKWTSTGSVSIDSYGASTARFVVLPTRRGSNIVAVCIESGGFSRRSLDMVAVLFPGSSASRSLFSHWHEADVLYEYRKGALHGINLGFAAWHANAGGSKLPGHILLRREFIWDRKALRFLPKEYRPDLLAENRLSLAAALLTPGSQPILGVRREEPIDDYLVYTYSPVGILKAKTPKEYWSAKRVKVLLKRVGEAQSGEYRIVSYESE